MTRKVIKAKENAEEASKLAEEKAKESSQLAEEVNKSVEEAQQRINGFKAECDKTQSELMLIPWYRFFKRRSTRQNLQLWTDHYYLSIEENKRKKEIGGLRIENAQSIAKIMESEAWQAKKLADDMGNKLKAEYISQRLSEEPNDVSIIEMWLSKPPICYEASSLKEKKYPIPKTKGIYAWYFAHGELNVPLNSYFKVDNFDLLYIGIAGRKSEGKGNLRGRIYRQHINGNAGGSTLRFSIGVLLREKGFLLELKRKGIFKKHIEWSNENDLTEWICNNALVAWIEHKHPKQVEEAVVKNFGHLLPLNILDNDKNEFARDLNKKRKQMRSEV